jgi:hypothetical protein
MPQNARAEDRTLPFMHETSPGHVSERWLARDCEQRNHVWVNGQGNSGEWQEIVYFRGHYERLWFERGRDRNEQVGQTLCSLVM